MASITLAPFATARSNAAFGPHHHEVSGGTVDKFQGQQAPVVFVSMTASSIDDAPRGIAFLLNRNRLNVAVSRAKYLAVIVRSPQLTDYLPGTPDRLVELGAFLSLSVCDTPGA